MRASVFFLVIISGCCFLSPSLSKTFVLIEQPAKWVDAQSHCRKQYTDLASVTNMEELNLLNQLDQSESLWLGLYGDPTEQWDWKYSVEDQDSGVSDLVDTGFRNWADNEPGGGQLYYRYCTIMFGSGNGKWIDEPCNWDNHVACYNGDPSDAIFIPEELMTWDEGRAYCRANYVNMAIVTNELTNEIISNKFHTNKRAWIGLYRESWKWSDGNNVTLTNWASGEPSGDGQATCVMSHGRKWKSNYCETLSKYACYGDAIIQKVVKLVVRVSEPSADITQLQEGILEELRQRMKKLNINGDVTIRWRKQPDGNVFHKETKEDVEEENVCPKP